MDIIRKIQYLLFCLLAIGFVACDDDDNNSTETGHEGILTQLAEEVDATAQQLWSSSPLIVNAGRTATLTKIQRYADKCKDDYFISYLNGFDQASTSMEKCDPIIYFYRSAFDRVMDGVKNSKVENGTAEIWALYNMGYVVKTQGVLLLTYLIVGQKNWHLILIFSASLISIPIIITMILFRLCLI